MIQLTPPPGLSKADFRQWLISSRREFIKLTPVSTLEQKNINLVLQLQIFFRQYAQRSGHWGSFKPLKDEPKISDLYLGLKAQLPQVSYEWFFPEVKNETDMEFSGLNEKELNGILIPGLAFSARGERMGRGKAYFDRYLQRSKTVLKVGVSYEEFVFDTLPTEAHDIPMDFLVTDHKIYKF